jgi:predicted ester cyclase
MSSPPAANPIDRVRHTSREHARARARVGVTGTHEGEFLGIPPTGRQVGVQLIDIMRFDHEGLVSEHCGVGDMLTLMQQLGVVPTAAPA